MRFVLVLALAIGVPQCAAFKFLSNFKASSLIPRPSNMLKKRQAAAKFGDKKIAVITGTSSGVGRKTAAALLATGEYHVVGAVRDLEKMVTVAKDEDFDEADFTPLECDLSSFQSVRNFCKELNKVKLRRPIDRLICNAGVYMPGEEPEFSTDGHEQQLQTNFLSHFLMVSQLLPSLTRSDDPRVTFVGRSSPEEESGVYPVSDLASLDGLKAGAKNPVSMIDGFNFMGAKAYKDSKLCVEMFSHMLHERYHRQTGIAFSTAYVGEIMDSELLKDKAPLDTIRLVPAFLKGITTTASSVTTDEAAQRIFQVSHDPRCSKSGIFWSWKDKEVAEVEAVDMAMPAGWEAIYEEDVSDKILNKGIGMELWKLSASVTASDWPTPNQPKSPCPTLKVIGAVTKAMNAKEEAKRMKAGDGVVGSLAGGAGIAVDAVAGSTIGFVAKTLQDKLLGEVPVTAVEGSFQETKKEEEKRLRGLASWRTAKAEGATDEEAYEAAAADELQQKVEAVLGESGMAVPEVEERSKRAEVTLV